MRRAVKSVDFFWSLFELTGSVVAYLLYRSASRSTTAG
ncbi:MAG TPA: YqzL family protein [Firmicutes bacterium]|nr:YqzL family protein [Bacillota bacterium]